MDLSLSDVTKLSGILQENGDQILNGTSKLSISVNLLQYLNKCFNLIVDEKEIQETPNTQFQVIHSNVCLDVFRDLQFLHDFIQKVIGLKITIGINLSEPFEGSACISKFRNLKLLEIRKVPVDYITGIKNLRSQIQYIICVKSLINSLDELLIQCGGDKCTTPFVWCELREASFSYNNLTGLDSKPFEYIPYLQMLDLSHNKLVNVQSLSCLHNLKHLNLSYNQLERLPLFSQEQSKHLQTLILKNNYIEDLAGLISLLCLRELDISCNCLIDHSTLFALPMLANLQILCLEGNPLSYHPNHRKITCRYLHSNTISVKFILDNMLLSSSESMQIGTYHTNSVRLNEYLQERRDYLNSSLTNSGTFSSVSSLESIKPAIKTELRQRPRKGRKVREAIINEPSILHHLPERSSKINVQNTERIIGDNVGSLESSIHLETKKQIEGLREQYGDLWLHSKGSSLIVQDILGMEKTPVPMFSSSPYLDIAKYITSSDNENSTSNSPNSLKTIVPDNESSTVTDETYETAATSSEVPSDYNTIVDSNYESGYDESGNVETEDDDNEPEPEEEEDANSKLFVVNSESNPDNQLFLCVSIEGKVIRERNATTGVTRERWPLSILQSCERTDKGVSLKFDTVKRDKASRNYILEDESEAQNLVSLLREVLDSRPLVEMNQTVFRCMKCSTQFSTENEILDLQRIRNLGTQCPFCKSKIVMEVEDEYPKLLPPLITARDLSPETAEIALPHSPSHSSIGSATSLNESIISSKVNTADNATRRGDSDIEVLSDPSQDSIEVLAVLARGSSLTPKRRRSSEERRFDMLSPILSTTSRDPPEAEISTTGLSATGIVAGLTESSSSDSLTDSVCTAYEQRKASITNTVINGKATNPVQVTAGDTSRKQDENTLYEQPELEITVNEPKTAESVGILSSMLEGLWNATSSLTSTAKPSLPSQYKIGDVEFSYANFTQIDHRVKLHLFLNIFEDENEELVWLIRAEILSHNAEKTFSGCVVLSTRKIYVLKIEGDIIGDEPQQWLIKSEGYSVDRLQTVFTLPWKQGIGFEIRKISLVGVESSIYILCFLQDLVYTTNFLAHLADASLPDTCELITKTSETTKLDILQLILSSTSEADADLTVRLLHVFTQCTISNNNTNEDANSSNITADAQKVINMGILLVTNSDMILTDCLAWLQPESTKTPSVYSTQSISNLVEVIRENNIVTLNFLDETTNKNEQWQLSTISNSAIDSIIEAIRGPWEQLFSIPLQVNIKHNSDFVQT